jgi:hypothetical protein
MNCKQCHKFLTKHSNYFCNRSCAAKYNNAKFPKRKKVAPMESKCTNCDKEFFYNPGLSSGKFCSNACFGVHRFLSKTVPKIERGIVEDTKTLRNYLSKTQGYLCNICKISEWNNQKITLHVDHIDGNSDNNLPSNIRLLCPNCHSQTLTFCGRNKKDTKRSRYNKNYRNKFRD